MNRQQVFEFLHGLATPFASSTTLYFYEELPPGGVCYREYTGGGTWINHEERGAVDSAEDTVRIEVGGRFDTGYSRQKLAASPTMLRKIAVQLLTGMMFAVFTCLTVTDASLNGSSLPAPQAGPVSVSLVVVAIVIGTGALGFSLHDLWKLYRVRTIGEGYSLPDETEHDNR